jgi:ABC-type polar amino acid transport system ATPase subunit
MTRVTDLSVRGFKAIEEVDIQPGGVNLIVGRNNVGKTSLLEAMYLCLDPTSVSRFGENLDKLVREGEQFDEGAVSVEYESGGDVDEELTDRDLHVRGANKNEGYKTLAALIKASTEILSRELPEMPSQIDLVKDFSNKENYRDYLLRMVAETAVQLDSDSVPQSIRDDMIVLRVGNESYIYIRTGTGYESACSDVLRRTKERIVSESHPEEIIKELGEKPGGEQLFSDLKNAFDPWHTRDFLRDTPSIVDGVNFIEIPPLDSDNADVDRDGAAIKRSDIEEFLVDNDIVEGLRDFSFDRLVFAEGEQKDEVPYDFMGSGFKTLVGILWELFDTDTEEDVVLIEEPAVHMHPGYVNEFTDQLLTLARQRDIQLFLTTHREDLIESFFSPATEHAHGEYLSEEFQLVKMTEPLTTQLDYEQAQAELEDVNADLRGI